MRRPIRFVYAHEDSVCVHLIVQPAGMFPMCREALARGAKPFARTTKPITSVAEPCQVGRALL